MFTFTSPPLPSLFPSNHSLYSHLRRSHGLTQHQDGFIALPPSCHSLDSLVALLQHISKIVAKIATKAASTPTSPVQMTPTRNYLVTTDSTLPGTLANRTSHGVSHEILHQRLVNARMRMQTTRMTGMSLNKRCSFRWEVWRFAEDGEHMSFTYSY